MTAVDIAMFGRMLASSPAFNVEAACQVAHAISVHPVVIEDDYFTAVDDLNNGMEDMGAAHIGETRFAAGLFYSYICINRELLIQNLDGNEDLANKAIRALTEAAVKVAPEVGTWGRPLFYFFPFSKSHNPTSCAIFCPLLADWLMVGCDNLASFICQLTLFKKVRLETKYLD